MLVGRQSQNDDSLGVLAAGAGLDSLPGCVFSIYSYYENAIKTSFGSILPFNAGYLAVS